MARRSRPLTPRRSSLRLESLEQRQLLATILAGSGSEVGSDIVHANGNTYDQILLTGPSVTVSADPGQIVRISYLDLGGDIIQTEFSGQGTVTVSLEEYRTEGMPGFVYKNPLQYINGEPIRYVQGLATVTVEKPSLATNIGFYAAGNLQNPGLFSKTDGDNGIADIARLIVIGDVTTAPGYSEMGGIFAGGVHFSASTGVVGIRAENVAVQSIVSIGDIDAKGSAIPALVFHQDSRIGSVFVRGGDLQQTNGTVFDPQPGQILTTPSIGGFNRFTSTDGTTSQGELLWSSPVDKNALRYAPVEQETLMAGSWVYDWTQLQEVKVTQNGVDVSKIYGGNWLAKGGLQASLDLAFERRSFGGNITFIGDVPVGYELNLADARGNVTLEGSLHGKLTVTGVGAGIDGTLLITGNVEGSILVSGLDRTQTPSSPGVIAKDGLQNAIHALVVEGSVGAAADIRAEDIGAVTIRKNFSGILSTDISRGNDWTAVPSALGGYLDVEGKIGAVSIGYDATGASTGGSIINGTIQGVSGIGNVKVGGDIYGTPKNQAVFVTASNPAAAATDGGRYGTASIGTIDVRGDVDLDAENLRLIFINGNGAYGNITIAGLTTSGTVSGVQTGTKSEVMPSSATFVRVLSPFTDEGFVANASKGQVLVSGYDPDGVKGPQDATYFVTSADVLAGAQVFDLAAGKLVAAKVGDRVPVLQGGQPALDVSGNVIYRQNTALFEGKTRDIPVYGPDVASVVSGNRGSLGGAYNHFGRIEIAGVIGGPQTSTGTISISDNVDLTFGGVSVRSTDAASGAAVSSSTIGAITLRNTAGATSDLRVVGLIGAMETDQAPTGYRDLKLAGLTITGFEDVHFAQGSSGTKGIQVGEVTQGITITTVTGVGSGTGLGTVSPSVTFDSVFLMGKGSGDTASATSLTVDAGLVNSTIGFTQSSGINGYVGIPATAVDLGAISLTADTIFYDGSLTGANIGALTLTGGTGASSGKDTAVRFGGSIFASHVASITAYSSEGNIVFAPSIVAGLGTKAGNNGITPVVSISGGIHLATSLTGGGDVSLGSGAVYDANLGNITITTGHIYRINPNGTSFENPGNVVLNLATSSHVGDISITTTTGDITDLLKVQGNAGNITYTAGAAVATNLQNVQITPGQPPDVVRFGDIKVNHTIWGNRGVTTLETYGQSVDGTAKTLPEYTAGGLTYRSLAKGTVEATVTYAGASIAAGDSLIVRTGGGQATVTLVVGSHDDNGDRMLSPDELGHGGNVAISSVSGLIRFNGKTDLPDGTSVSTLGNVTLKAGAFTPSSGSFTPDHVGDIQVTLGSVVSNGGFEGKQGDLTATTVGGDITLTGIVDGLAGRLTLTAGSIRHAGVTSVGDINFTGGLTLNHGFGLMAATTMDIGTIKGVLTSNGANGGGVQLASQYGAITATLAAGSFDTNNDGQFSANEYGRTGNVAITTAGGGVNLTLNSHRYVSGLEQSAIGNVSIATSAFVDVRAGAFDLIGQGVSALGSPIGTGARAEGGVTVTGAATQTGAVGNLTITTQVGKIQHFGTFGDMGASTFTTGSVLDLDSVGTITGEPPVTLESGYIDLSVEVNGLHGLSRYTVTGDGTISGTGSYGGAALGTESLITSSQRGNTTLVITLHDADRNKNGIISSDEYGTFGSSRLETLAGGDVFYTMEILPRNTDVLSKKVIPELSFGDVTASVVDRYDLISSSSLDVLGDAGKITIVGKTDVGTVGNITAATVRGDLRLVGVFGNLGDQNLSVTRYLDEVGADTHTFLGNLSSITSVYGTSGTAVLRTDDSGTTGNGVSTGGSISGSAFFGGSIAAGKTTSIDAKTGKASIDFEVYAGSYDRNGDGQISDGSNPNQAGGFEFAKVGDIRVETTRAGDIRLGLATDSANGSKIGPSIGKVFAIADDDFIPALAQVNDMTGTNVDLANVTVIGLSDPTRGLVGGSIGDMSIVVGVGQATLSGHFVNLGETSVTTSSYVDSSVNLAGDTQLIASGNIRLGTLTGSGATATTTPDPTGKGTLNIAGSYKNTALSVTGLGTITGLVFAAGQGRNDWTLTSEKGHIDIGFVAGFDTDFRDAAGKSPRDPGYNPATTSISPAEAGAIGSISVKSTFNADVTLALGGRSATSSIGSVSVSTGDVVTAKVGEKDGIVSGNTLVRGIGVSGSIATVTTQIGTGLASMTGDFGALGNVTIRTTAYVDEDTTSTVGDEPVVIKAGDILLDNVVVYGAHGTMDLATIDSSALPAGKSALAGTVFDTGNISGSVYYGGGLASGVTSGLIAKSDRGTVFLGLAAGLGKTTNVFYDPETAAAVGNVAISSVDGSISLGVHNRNRASSFGNISLSTGDTWETVAGGVDVARSVGWINFEAVKWLPVNALGTIGDIDVKTVTGNLAFGGVTGSYFNNVGKISVTTGSWTDLDSTSAGGEAPVTLAGGHISFKTDFYGLHNTVTLKAADTPFIGMPTAMNPGSITGYMNMYGSLAAGTESLVLNTQSGDVWFDLNALTRPLVADKTDADIYQDNPDTNADDQVGRIGNVVAESKAGSLRIDVRTVSVPKVSSADDVRYTAIGNISATTGSSYEVVAGAGNDLLRAPGNITITASRHSNGILGNISAQTVVGDIRFGAGSVFHHQVGDITLRAGSYSDGMVLDAGDVHFLGTFASTQNNAGTHETTIGAVTLSASGVVSNGGVGAAGNVFVKSDFGSRWNDVNLNGRIDPGEQASFRGGAFVATVTDGQISYEIDSAADAFGFGAQLPVTTLRSTGTSTHPTTGNITIDNTGFRAGFSHISSFTTETVDGDVSFFANWSSVAVDTFQLNAGKGKVLFDGLLQLNTPKASNYDSAQLRMQNFILNAENGEVVVGTHARVGGAFNPHLEYYLPNGVLDSRSFVLEKVTLKAGGGSGLGNVSVLGLIGGVEITEIRQMLFEVPIYTGSIELNSAGLNAPNILAHDMGTIRFNGNAKLSGGTVILASDILTGRSNLNGLNYIANTPAAAENKGSALDVIDELIFNGSVTGNTVASLITGNRAEIEASKIGSISIQAKIDPSMDGRYTVSNLDILASNSRGGFAQGEALLMAGYSALDAAHAIQAFNFGNITITHDLIAPVGGTTVFADSNAFSALGGMGDITVTSVPSGVYQAPMLTPTGAAWFAVGDGNGLGNLDGRVDGYGNNTFVDYHAVSATAGVPGDKVSIGNVLINVGSSHVPPANPVPDFGNIGGSAALPYDGFAILAAAIAPTAANNAARRIAAYTDLYGYIASVEMRGSTLRPNADGTDFAVVENALFGGSAPNGDGNLGAFIAVAGDNSNAGIGDVINDQNPAIVPLLPGQGRIIGLAGNPDEYDQGDIVVYVL